MAVLTSDLLSPVTDILAQLAALGHDQVRDRNARLGAGPDQYGVKLGDIRRLAAKFKNDHELGLTLWETGNLEARLMALLLLKPQKLSSEK